MHDPHESLDPDLDHIAPLAAIAGRPRPGLPFPTPAIGTSRAATGGRQSAQAPSNSQHADTPVGHRKHRRTLGHRLITVGLIVVGGAFGTLMRDALEQAFPTRAGTFVWTTFGINVCGAFLLGLLLSTVRRHGPDSGWRRRVRLAVGTGLLGGFTTYSTFAVEVVSTVSAGATATGIAYALASILAGVAAAGLGLWLPQHLTGGHGPGTPESPSSATSPGDDQQSVYSTGEGRR